MAKIKIPFRLCSAFSLCSKTWLCSVVLEPYMCERTSDRKIREINKSQVSFQMNWLGLVIFSSILYLYVFCIFHRAFRFIERSFHHRHRPHHETSRIQYPVSGICSGGQGFRLIPTLSSRLSTTCQNGNPMLLRCAASGENLGRIIMNVS